MSYREEESNDEIIIHLVEDIDLNQEMKSIINDNLIFMMIFFIFSKLNKILLKL